MALQGNAVLAGALGGSSNGHTLQQWALAGTGRNTTCQPEEARSELLQLWLFSVQLPVLC